MTIVLLKSGQLSAVRPLILHRGGISGTTVLIGWEMTHRSAHFADLGRPHLLGRVVIEAGVALLLRVVLRGVV